MTFLLEYDWHGAIDVLDLKRVVMKSHQTRSNMIESETAADFRKRFTEIIKETKRVALYSIWTLMHHFCYSRLTQWQKVRPLSKALDWHKNLESKEYDYVMFAWKLWEEAIGIEPEYAGLILIDGMVTRSRHYEITNAEIQDTEIQIEIRNEIQQLFLQIKLRKNSKGKENNEEPAISIHVKHRFQDIPRLSLLLRAQTADGTVLWASNKKVGTNDPQALLKATRMKLLTLVFARRMGIPHDVYQKAAQLNRLPIHPNRRGVLIADEAQDLNDCQLQWLIDQQIPLHFIGDAAQEIYQFRGSHNALGKIPVNTTTYRLRTTFRFGPEIADVINIIGRLRKFKFPDAEIAGKLQELVQQERFNTRT